MSNSDNQNQQQVSDETYNQTFELIKKDIENIEEFKAQQLAIRVFKHSENGENHTAIRIEKTEKSGVKVLYFRMFSGTPTPELKYMCIFFLWKDILNQGIRLMHRLAIEQDAITKENRKEIKIIGDETSKPKEEGGKIILLNK